MAPGDLRRPAIRLTVDTPADLDFARRIQERVESDGHLPSTREIIRAASAILAAQRNPMQGAYAIR